MTTLQLKGIQIARQKIDRAHSLIGRQATDPKDSAKDGTHTNEVTSELLEAARWLAAVEGDAKSG